MDTLKNPHCPDIQNCKRSHECHSDSEFCFSKFKYDAEKGVFQPIASGCKWFQIRTKPCSDQTENMTDSCILHKGKDNTFQCCCSGDNCNKNLVFSKINFTASISLVKDVSEVKGGVTLQGIFF